MMRRKTFMDDPLPAAPTDLIDCVADEQTNLKQKLKEGAIRNAERDLQMAEEWFPLDEETWQKHQEGKHHAKSNSHL